MWVLDTPVYRTVPQFRGCDLAESSRESGIYMKECGNRQEEIIVFLKVKGEDQIFQSHINWETYWHLLSTTWDTQII